LTSLPKVQGDDQATLAKRAGLTREYVNKLEAGKQDPSLTTISALSKALGVPVSELVEQA
jgi:transcriptional regulator with XRE-family HTH domain